MAEKAQPTDILKAYIARLQKRNDELADENTRLKLKLEAATGNEERIQQAYNTKCAVCCLCKQKSVGL